MYYLGLALSWIIIFFLLIFLILYINSIINSIKYKVPQVWTFSSDFKVMKKWLWKYNLKWKKLADLWSGSWKSLRFFESEFEMKTTWYEIDFSNVIISKFLNYIFWCNGEIIKWNYLKKDLSDFDVIYIYWFTVLMLWIEKKIWKDCKKWTLLISNAFKMPNKEPNEVLLDDKWREEVYIYEI